MKCTQCGDPLQEGSRYLAVFEAPNGALRFEQACAHRAPKDVGNALAILNSIECAQKWLGTWMNQQNCNHK